MMLSFGFCRSWCCRSSGGCSISLSPVPAAGATSDARFGSPSRIAPLVALVSTETTWGTFLCLLLDGQSEDWTPTMPGSKRKCAVRSSRWQWSNWRKMRGGRSETIPWAFSTPVQVVAVGGGRHSYASAADDRWSKEEGSSFLSWLLCFALDLFYSTGRQSINSRFRICAMSSQTPVCPLRILMGDNQYAHNLLDFLSMGCTRSLLYLSA